MPSTALGQQITLAIQVDSDPAPNLPTYAMIATKVGDSIQAIASRVGQPLDARAVADLNGVRSVTQIINNRPHRKGDLAKVRVPSRMRQSQALNVLAGAQPPKITGGYAKFTTIARYGRTGITQFTGYDPLLMTIPLMFEGYSTRQPTVIDPDGDVFARAANIQAQRLYQQQLARAQGIEADIQLLERMAGRGSFPGAGIGPPPVIRASTTDAQGNVVGLIPAAYQWTRTSSGLLWRMTDIVWDDSAIRNEQGNRIRATCTVTLEEHTKSSLVSQSAAQRAKAK